MNDSNQNIVFTVADLKPLAKPLEKLIDSVSKGIGGRYKPFGIVREAKAKAQANLILAQANIEIQELTHRAADRIVFIELRRQKNIESIAGAAAKMMPESVDGQAGK